MKKYSEAEKALNKPFRTSSGPKKFAVYVKDPKSGNVKIVRFGDPNMEIKRDDPERRKSFRARHNCDQQKDKTTPGYWSCKMWSQKPVSKMTASNNFTYEVDLTEWDGETFLNEEEFSHLFSDEQIEEIQLFLIFNF
jgi:hypothetical protein